MATFIFAYRVPRNYTPGSPETAAAWRAWFDSLGTHVVEQGLLVVACSPPTMSSGDRALAAAP